MSRRLGEPRATIRLLLRLRVGESSSSLVVPEFESTLNHRALAVKTFDRRLLLRRGVGKTNRRGHDTASASVSKRLHLRRHAFDGRPAGGRFVGGPVVGGSVIGGSVRRPPRRPRRVGSSSGFRMRLRPASAETGEREFRHERGTRALSRRVERRDAAAAVHARVPPRRESRRRSRPRPGEETEILRPRVPPLGSLQTRVLLEQTLPASLQLDDGQVVLLHRRFLADVGSIPGVSSTRRHHTQRNRRVGARARGRAESSP